jgi:hypothetical protein
MCIVMVVVAPNFNVYLAAPSEGLHARADLLQQATEGLSPSLRCRRFTTRGEPTANEHKA